MAQKYRERVERSTSNGLLVSAQGVSDILGLSVRQVHLMLARGDLPYVTLGTRRFVRRDDLLQRISTTN